MCSRGAVWCVTELGGVSVLRARLRVPGKFTATTASAFCTQLIFTPQHVQAFDAFTKVGAHAGTLSPTPLKAAPPQAAYLAVRDRDTPASGRSGTTAPTMIPRTLSPSGTRQWSDKKSMASGDSVLPEPAITVEAILSKAATMWKEVRAVTVDRGSA